MSISEFEEVGDAIKSFTSEDATVIVGTVIDPEMTDELRVTLVATGLGKAISGDSRRFSEAPTARVERRSETLNSRFDKNVLARGSSNNKVETPEQTEPNMDYLDIPAFLRRQSD